jgi:hypothetical protein
VRFPKELTGSADWSLLEVAAWRHWRAATTSKQQHQTIKTEDQTKTKTGEAP